MAKQTKSRIGFNTAEAGVTDKPYFIDLTKRLRSNWVLVINSDQMCQQLISTGANVIDRRTALKVEDGVDVWGMKKYKMVADEGNVWRYNKEWRTASKYVESLILSSPEKNTFKYVLNEPNVSNAEEMRLLCDWLVEVGTLLLARGYRAVLGNFPPASENWDWARMGVYDKLIAFIQAHPEEMKYGAHGYTWGTLPMGVGVTSYAEVTPDNLNAMRPDRWANANQINERTTWHLLRALWLGKFPIVYTELAVGKMSDIPSGFYQTMEAHFPSSAGRNGLDGWESLKNLYRVAYPQWTHAQAIVEQLKWLDRVTPANIEGYCIFAYGTFADYGQDESGNTELHERLVSAFGGGSYTPPVIKPIPPTPTIPTKTQNWQSARLSPKSTAWVNMRDSAGMSGKVVRKVSRNTSALVLLDGSLPDVNDKNLSWLSIRIGALSGYIRSDVVTITWVK